MGITKVWGHRGAAGYAPENTIPAFALAAEQGADGVELDIQLTRDGEIVVIHDETIDRVSNGTGRVMDYSLEELKRLNFNKNFPQFGFVTIPTLEEVFSLLKDSGLVVNVELKTNIVFYEGIEEKAVQVAEKMGMSERVIYSSFNHYSVLKVKEFAPRTKTGFLYTDGIINIAKYAKQYGVNAIHPPANNLKYRGVVQSCMEEGINIHVWNVRDNDVEFCVQNKIAAVITNFVDRTKRIVERG